MLDRLERLNDQSVSLNTPWPLFALPGGKFWPIADLSRREACPVCDGNQTVILKGGQFRCQSCSDGMVFKPWWRTYVEAWVVDQVSVVLDHDKVWLKLHCDRFSTVADHKASDAFATREEAQAECDRRNGVG